MLPDSVTITQGKFKVPLPDSKTVTRGELKSEIAFDYRPKARRTSMPWGCRANAPVKIACRPPDLDRIIKIVQQHRRDFGDYLAVPAETMATEPRSCTVHLIRCKGDKFRVDDGIGYAMHVASGDEMEQWWREYGKEILFEGMALCDGRRVYEHSFVPPKPWWKPSTIKSPRRRARRWRQVSASRQASAYAAEYSSTYWRIRRDLDPHS